MKRSELNHQSWTQNRKGGQINQTHTPQRKWQKTNRRTPRP